MSKVIMAGCDLHDRSMLIRYAVGTSEPVGSKNSNDASRPLLKEPEHRNLSRSKYGAQSFVDTNRRQLDFERIPSSSWSV